MGGGGRGVGSRPRARGGRILVHGADPGVLISGQAGREEGEEQSEYYVDSSEDEHPV